MAVPIHILHYKKAITLTTKWVLAEDLTEGLLMKTDQQKLFGFTVDGHHYFSSREVLSVIEQYLTTK